MIPAWHWKKALWGVLKEREMQNVEKNLILVSQIYEHNIDYFLHASYVIDSDLIAWEMSMKKAIIKVKGKRVSEWDLSMIKCVT